MICDDSYIVGHAIVAGKLASGDLNNKEEYINECSKHGVSAYSGGDACDRFFNANRIHKSLKTFNNYDAYTKECEDNDVRIIYSESSFEYSTK